VARIFGGSGCLLSASDGALVDFGVLGPLRVNGADVVLAAKQRIVLAVLLLHANRVAPVNVLWDEAPPPSARATLQGYVKHLRHKGGAGGRCERVRCGLRRVRQVGVLASADHTSAFWSFRRVRSDAALGHHRGRQHSGLTCQAHDFPLVVGAPTQQLQALELGRARRLEGLQIVVV
jgi:hypothetical protein